MKHARVFVDGELVFDNVVEKGCGNQVFDYGHNIDLIEIEPSPRSPKPTSPASVSPPPVKSDQSQSAISHHNVPKSTSPVSYSRRDEETIDRNSQKSHSPVRKSEDKGSKPKPAKRIIPDSPSQARPSSSDRKSGRPLPSLPLRSETRTMNHSDKSFPKPVISERTSLDEDQNKGQLSFKSTYSDCVVQTFH